MKFISADTSELTIVNRCTSGAAPAPSEPSEGGAAPPPTRISSKLSSVGSSRSSVGAGGGGRHSSCTAHGCA